MRRFLIVSVLACLLWAGISTTAAQSGPVSVRLELNQQFYYAGDSLEVRISVRNDGTEAIPNPIKSPLFKAFKVHAGAQPLRARGKALGEEPSRPQQLAPQSFYGGLVDLRRIYPELGEVGTYRIHWEADGLRSDQLVVTIIPRYDPNRTYLGRIETSQGQILVNFYPEHSPLAVKAFIDMANAGFYDGMLYDEVRADTYIAAGNPALAPSPRQPFLYPAEQSTLPLMAGTVVMKPAGATPPANGPEFLILLRPHQAWTGQVTVLGQVVRGLDVAQAISRVPSTGQSERPFFRPKQDVRIQKVTILENKPDEGGLP